MHRVRNRRFNMGAQSLGTAALLTASFWPFNEILSIREHSKFASRFGLRAFDFPKFFTYLT